MGQWFLTFPVGLGLFMFGNRRIDHHALDGATAFKAIGQALAAWLPAR